MRRRFRRRPSFVVILLATLAAIVLMRIGWDWLQRTKAAGRYERGAAHFHNRQTVLFVAGPCTVVQVIDSDALLIRQLQRAPQREETLTVEGPVRLLGVRIASDPVRVADDPLAVAARQYVEEFVGSGDVTLELDKRRADADGCFLAYVVVNGQMLNAELVRAGLARVDSVPGDSATVSRLLQRAEDEAKAAGRGVWRQ